MIPYRYPHHLQLAAELERFAAAGDLAPENGVTIEAREHTVRIVDRPRIPIAATRIRTAYPPKSPAVQAERKAAAEAKRARKAAKRAQQAKGGG